MLEKKRKLLAAFLFAAVGLMPVIIIFRILIVIKLIDPNTLLYEIGNPVPDIFNYVVCGLAAALLVCGLFFRMYFSPSRAPEPPADADPADPYAPPVRRRGFWGRVEKGPLSRPLHTGSALVFENRYASTVFASTVTGFIFIASAILIAGSYLLDSSGAARSYEYGRAASSGMDVLNVVILAAAILSGFYLLLSGMKKVDPYSGVFSFLSLAPTVWCALRLVACYSDLSENSNEYSHVLQIACLVFITLFFFSEGRFTLADPAGSSIALYVGSGLASLILIAAMSVPNLLLASFWMVDFNAGVFNSLVEFFIAIYIVAKLTALTRKLAKLPESEVSFVRPKPAKKPKSKNGRDDAPDQAQ